MNNHSTEEYAAAIQTINSTIANCEKAQLKFKAGSFFFNDTATTEIYT